MIGKLLGHRGAQTTGRYAHSAREPVQPIARRATFTFAADVRLRPGPLSIM